MGKEWPSTEHFFQAQKYVGTPIAERIRKCRSAREAFEMARKPQYQAWLRPDWHKRVKDDVMHLAVKEKFIQHRDLQKLLLGTGEREIIEHTTNDSYWGDGGGWGRGQNKLGKILMQVRDELRQSQPLDDYKEKFLPHRSRSTERGLGKSGSSPRPRSGSVGRIPEKMAEFGYEHSNRRDVQPTAGDRGTGREHSSRRDGQLNAGVGVLGKGSSTGRGVQPTAGSGGAGREHSSRSRGAVQFSSGFGDTGSGGHNGQWKTVSQGTSSRMNGTRYQPPLSSYKLAGTTRPSKSNDSSQVAAALDHSH